MNLTTNKAEQATLNVPEGHTNIITIQAPTTVSDKEKQQFQTSIPKRFDLMLPELLEVTHHCNTIISDILQDSKHSSIRHKH